MDALEFIGQSRTGKPQPVYVLFGDEDFLKRQVRADIEPMLLEDADPAFALSTYPGDTANWSTIRGELDTLPFLSPRRVVVVEQADSFVSVHRPQLEKYVAKPGRGTLILEVRTWPSTTKLAKAVPDGATFSCKTPGPRQLPAWCVKRAQSAYGKKLSANAAQMLVELIEPSLGLLDQELAKLAVYLGERVQIDADDVDTLCGRSRGAETFKIFNAIGEGRAGDALAILHRLRDDGQDAIPILGAFSWQLRRLAQAARLTKQGVPVGQAISQAGIGNFGTQGAEQQMRHLGMRRLEKLYDWLIEVDIGIKGDNPLPPMMQIERLLVRLAQPREAAKPVIR